MIKLIYRVPILIALFNILLLLLLYLYGRVDNGYFKEFLVSAYNLIPINYLLASGLFSLFAIAFSAFFRVKNLISIGTYRFSIILNVIYITAYIYWLGRQ